MKAKRVEKHGGPEVLQLADLPDPTPGPGQLLVRVEAAGLNFIDTYHRTGLYPMELPFTLGLEGAGVVAGLGPDESVRIQERGVGPHRKLGCGLFIQHKGIEPVAEQIRE